MHHSLIVSHHLPRLLPLLIPIKQISFQLIIFSKTFVPHLLPHYHGWTIIFFNQSCPDISTLHTARSTWARWTTWAALTRPTDARPGAPGQSQAVARCRLQRLFHGGDTHGERDCFLFFRTNLMVDSGWEWLIIVMTQVFFMVYAGEWWLTHDGLYHGECLMLWFLWWLIYLWIIVKNGVNTSWIQGIITKLLEIGSGMRSGFDPGRPETVCVRTTDHTTGYCAARTAPRSIALVVAGFTAALLVASVTSTDRHCNHHQPSFELDDH